MNEPATYRDFLVGFSGTSFATLAANVSAHSAAAAGIATCIWMLTQTVLALVKHHSEKKTRRQK